MGNKKWKSIASLVLAAALAVGGVNVASPLTAQAETVAEGRAAATTYYIDAANGNDSNNGTSEATAWKTFANVEGLELTAGQQVLLKAGCVWNNEKLMLKNAKGTAENPVILGRYGEGDDPVINGNGCPWLDGVSVSTRNKEDVAAVHVQNSEYITIQNLEVTNWESDPGDLMGEAGGKVVYDQSKSMLTGLLVENRDAGEIKGVVIKDNYVHDVNGYMSQNGSEGHKKGSGGIMALVTGGNVESFYTDLKITGNKVEKVCHEAIYMESCWAARTLVGGAASQQAGSKKWVGWPNVYVAHNYVNNVAGDGVVLINADGGVAEYNLVTASASEEWNYSRNPAHAAIWMWDCNNVTMQYNEAAHTTSTQDGMAFDCDYGNQNVMYQYNYSHDNKGGFWMACPGPYYTVNAVVRYNVSVNDGLFDGSRIVHIGEYGSIGNQVYNNTIYWNTGYQDIKAVEQGTWVWGANGQVAAKSSGTDIYNNIFCGDSVLYENHEGVRYDSNCVWGSSQYVYPLDEDKNAVVADPGFRNVKDYTEGSFQGHQVTLGAAEGMKLRQDSPCINAGREYMPVPEESFPAVANEMVPTHITLENRDYDGNAVPYASANAADRRVDIGAFEYQGEGTYAGGEDAAYLNALIEQASGYQEAEFTKESWAVLQDAIKKAQEAIGSAQSQLVAARVRLENALLNMELLAGGDPGDERENILASYGAPNDNAGFESEGTDWGYWQSTVGVSTEQARTGSKSLKVEQENSSQTAYSEIGRVPVEINTEYVLEAWVNCGDADLSSLGLEAKHHNSVTGSGDVKLANISLSADAETDDKGWAKAVLSFRTTNWQLVSLSLSSNTGTVYMDDVVLYKKESGTKVPLDRKAIEAAIALAPGYSQVSYSADSWKNYQDKLLAAKLKRVDVKATQASLDQAAQELQAAFEALELAADKTALQALYQEYAAKEKGDYTNASWQAFQKALEKAKAELDKEPAIQQDLNQAESELRNAYSRLEKKADSRALQALYQQCAAKQKGNYTDASWAAFQDALKKAKAVLDEDEPAMDKIDNARIELIRARDALQVSASQPKSQKISYTKSYEKAYKANASFKLNAKVTTGNGKLSFGTSDKKVATVDKNGKVAIKGIGICTITVKASATKEYKAASVNVKVTVKPQKPSVKAAKAVKGRKLSVSWKKDSKATGYQVQCCLKKNFKSGVKKAEVKKASKVSASFSKLTKNKKYYVRVRTYKTVKVNGKNTKVYSDWSSVRLSGKIK